MSFRAFIHFPKTCIKRFIFILSWFCWVSGMALLIFQIYNICAWTFYFPDTSGIRISSWFLLFSLQIFSMWMPFSLLLTYWNKRQIWIHVVYICGCILSLALSVAATISLDNYKYEGEVRREYITSTLRYIKDYSELPRWAAWDKNNKKCCGWFSPLDIGHLFPMTPKLRKNKKYLEQVAHCFGDIFKVKTKDPQDFEFIADVIGIKPNYPVGCGAVFKHKAREICYFTVYCGLFISIFALVFVGAYSIYIIQGRPIKKQGAKILKGAYEEDVEQDEPRKTSSIVASMTTLNEESYSYQNQSTTDQRLLPSETETDHGGSPGPVFSFSDAGVDDTATADADGNAEEPQSQKEKKPKKKHKKPKPT